MVMKKEMKEKNSDFMCVCNMCSNYTYCLAEDAEQEKLIKELCLYITIGNFSSCFSLANFSFDNAF